LIGSKLRSAGAEKQAIELAATNPGAQAWKQRDTGATGRRHMTTINRVEVTQIAFALDP
jgi:hypothetical protein